MVNLAEALTTNTPSTKQSYDTATGAGTVEAARGTPHLSDGVELQGETDITGTAVNTAALASQRLSGRMWSGGSWSGRMWSGGSWAGRMWSGVNWSGRMWSGDVWSSAGWY